MPKGYRGNAIIAEGGQISAKKQRLIGSSGKAYLTLNGLIASILFFPMQAISRFPCP
jgi:hypothetical protein